MDVFSLVVLPVVGLLVTLVGALLLPRCRYGNAVVFAFGFAIAALVVLG